MAPDAVPSYVAAYSRAKRLDTRNYLSRTVKDLRKFFKGFDPASGYDLSRVETWPASRAAHVRQYGEYLHNLQSSPYVRVPLKKYRKPKKQKTFEREIRRAVGQGAKRQRAIVYHVEQTTRPTKVALSPQGTLEIREELPSGKQFLKRYWYFRDYIGRQPRTFTDVINAAKKMLRDMPDNLWFSLMSVPHGVIDVPVQKEFILQTLYRYRDEYGTHLHEGFGEQLIGFAFFGTEDQAFKSYNKRLQRRMRNQMQKSAEAKIRHKRLRFQLRMGRVR